MSLMAREWARKVADNEALKRQVESLKGLWWHGFRMGFGLATATAFIVGYLIWLRL